MDDETNIESEVKEMFGIADELDVTPTDTANPQPSTDATTEQAPTQPVENTSSDTTENVEPAKSTTATGPTEKKTEDTPFSPEEKFNKQNSAFAQMRIQNKELSDLLMSLAAATGQNPKNVSEAQTILKEGLNKLTSKNRNIPEDVLREMEEDKKAIASFKQEQAKQKALAGFQAVKDKFTLSRDEVNTFADKLIENKLNPFEQDLNLVKEYEYLYFEELLAKAKEQGVQEERARSSKAQQNSTTPSTRKGISDSTGDQSNPIKTVEELDKLLNSLKN